MKTSENNSFTVDTDKFPTLPTLPSPDWGLVDPFSWQIYLRGSRSRVLSHVEGRKDFLPIFDLPNFKLFLRESCSQPFLFRDLLFDVPLPTFSLSAPTIFLFYGVKGSGKGRLAKWLAGQFNEVKQLDPDDFRIDRGEYSWRPQDEKPYELVESWAERRAEMGKSTVISGGGYGLPRRREALKKVAERTGATFCPILFVADVERQQIVPPDVVARMKESLRFSEAGEWNPKG